MALRKFVVLIALFICFQMDMYSAVKIKIKPRKFNAEKDTTVKVECSMNEKEDQASEFNSIKISRKGARAMVVIYANNTIEYIAANDEEVDATGKIETADTGLMKSFLNMEIMEPDTEDTGAYFCHVFYMMPSGTPMVNKARANLKVFDPEVNKLNSQVTDLLDKMKKEQSELKQMEQKGKKDKSKVTDLEVTAKKQENEITNLLNKEHEVESKVTELEEKTETQLKKIQELSNKEDTEVKSLKSTIKGLVDKMKKDEEEIKEIGDKELEDKAKVTDLEEKAEEQTRELQDLVDKEKKVEKKVNELSINAKMALKKMQELAKKGVNDKSKVVELEDKAEEQSKEMMNLAAKESEVEAKLAELEAKVDRFIKKVNDLKAKANALPDTGIIPVTNPVTLPVEPKTAADIVAFSATNQNKFIKVDKGMTIVFPDIVMQAGSVKAFNEMTGAFTAPVDGLYHFSLVIKVNCISCYVRAHVMANQRLLFRLKVGVIYDDTQNSASSVAQLRRGEMVRPVVDYATEGAVLTPARLCLFSGYLIAAM